MTRLSNLLLVLVASAVFVLGSAASPDRKPPRIVAAAVEDANGDARADRVRLTYSERVRHRSDRDGNYPFAVAGYRIRSIGPTSSKVLLIQLVERAVPDPDARPAVRYRRTRVQPVRDLAGNQAVAQLVARARAHGHTPPAPPPPAALDTDRDGTPDTQDCGPKDASVHPGAQDMPDLTFADSNCDGIDGTETDAVFVAPNGADANPGTKGKPKREIQAGVDTAAAGKKRYVLVASGTYGHVTVVSGIGVYGGYEPTSWKRKDRFPNGLPSITGSPEGVLAQGAKDIVLQYLAIRGQTFPATNVRSENERSAYGIRAINGSSLTVQRVAISVGDGVRGGPGADGTTGQNAGDGGVGDPGSCNGSLQNHGGVGGTSPGQLPGGNGGVGGWDQVTNGAGGGVWGKVGTPGGAAGKDGNPGHPGGTGSAGENGASGPGGAGGVNASAKLLGKAWNGQNGALGLAGKPGNGGGGGGGGGAQHGRFADDGSGNAGGGGGGGGGAGSGGEGGQSGGGSFGIYLANSSLTLRASTIVAGNGGAGGAGGDGGFGGAGGTGGKGGTRCTSEIGAGGKGGHGGAGGRGGGGGGGLGGPSVGIYKAGSATATLKDNSKVAVGVAGAGGTGGSSGPGGAGGNGALGIAQTIVP